MSGNMAPTSPNCGLQLSLNRYAAVHYASLSFSVDIQSLFSWASLLAGLWATMAQAVATTLQLMATLHWPQYLTDILAACLSE